MYNFFEHPWLLVIIAFISLIAVYVFRSTFPDKRKFWQILIKVLILVIAFGLDYLVKTDKEKIKSIFETGIKATMDKDIQTIASLFADDYSDRFHPNKAAVVQTARHLIAAHNFERAVMTYHDITVEGPEASAEILVRVHLDNQNSSYPAPELVYARLKLDLTKRGDQTWAIKSTDLVEINNQSVNWNRVR